MDENKNASGAQDPGTSPDNHEVPFNGSLKQAPDAANASAAQNQMPMREAAMGQTPMGGAPMPQGMQGQPGMQPGGMPQNFGNYPNMGQGGTAPYGGQPMQPPQYQQVPPQGQVQQQAQPQQNGGATQDSQGQQNQDGKRAAHAKKAQSAFIQRSSKMRKLYVVIIILLVVAVVAIGFLAANIIWTADNSATQQTQTTSTDLTQVGEGDDTKDSDTPKTTVPNLVELLGKSRKQAIEMIGHGAEVVSSRKVKEEDSDIRREVRIELTDEPADSRSGAPTVYLSLNKAGKVVHAGYSVAISSLGYGSASFGDTVESEHIVENTLGEAGLNVELGSAVLPEDVTEYSKYSSDGSTVTKEYYSFSGKGTANGKKYDWEAILSYDYTVANASENLNDTLRTIFVYVS